MSRSTRSGTLFDVAVISVVALIGFGRDAQGAGAFTLSNPGASARAPSASSGEDRSQNTRASVISIKVTGTPEVFISSSQFVCQPPVGFASDDIPPRAYRDAAGTIHFFAVNAAGMAFTGPSFSQLKQDCTPIYVAPSDPAPSHFNFKAWVIPYAIGGNYIFALIHNEYHGLLVSSPPGFDYRSICRAHLAAGQKRGAQTCWYTSSEAFASNDGGYTFAPINPGPPDYGFVFGIPYTFNADMTRAGATTVAMIKSPVDGYYYSLVAAFPYEAQQRGTCLARSIDLKTWNFWTGTDTNGNPMFNGTFMNPYTGTDVPGNHVCPPVSTTPGTFNSLVYVRPLRQFVSVIVSNERDDSVAGAGAQGVGGGKFLVFRYITSPDLIHWSNPQTFFSQKDDNSQALQIWYPSFIDPNSSSANFDVTNGSLYLYYVKWPNGAKDNRHRDVMRVPVLISGH